MDTNKEVVSVVSICPQEDNKPQNQTSNIGHFPDNQMSPSVQLSNHAPKRPGFVCHLRAGDWGSAGVYYYAQAKGDGPEPEPIWLCSPLVVMARTRDKNSESWGRLLRWHDPDGYEKTWGMPDSLLMGESNALLAQLADGGLDIGISNRRLVLQYLQHQKSTLRATCVSQSGWAAPSVYVADDFVVNLANDELYIFQSDKLHEYQRCRGTIDSWRSEVASLCVGNSRLMFSISCAFAGPLLEPCSFSGGGLHFQGPSSIGKSLTMWLAASVMDNPNHAIVSWRATDNGLEGVAKKYCDRVLMLDELGQVDGKKAGDIAYMLSNGKGKARASKDGSARPALTWRIIFLSNGEIDLATHMESSGKNRMAGQEVRMVTIPADAGKGYGIFENLHGSESGREFSARVKHAGESHYGTALKPLVEHVAANWELVGSSGGAAVGQFVQSVVPVGADGQIARTAERFGIIAFAGELATELGITGWKAGDAKDAAKSCFMGWLSTRHGIASSEEYEIIERLRNTFLKDSSRFESMETAHKKEQSMVRDRLGFVSGGLYKIPTHGFKEIMRGLDIQLAARVLKKVGIINHPIGKKLPRVMLPGLGRQRCYTIDSESLPD